MGCPQALWQRVQAAPTSCLPLNIPSRQDLVCMCVPGEAEGSWPLSQPQTKAWEQKPAGCGRHLPAGGYLFSPGGGEEGRGNCISKRFTL